MKLNRIKEMINLALDLTQSPCTMDDLIAAACSKVGYEITNTGSYYLTHLTMAAYLSYLLDKNLVTAVYKNNRQFFCRI